MLCIVNITCTELLKNSLYSEKESSSVFTWNELKMVDYWDGGRAHGVKPIL